jgi:hypothetical protein
VGVRHTGTGVGTIGAMIETGGRCILCEHLVARVSDAGAGCRVGHWWWWWWWLLLQLILRRLLRRRRLMRRLRRRLRRVSVGSVQCRQLLRLAHRRVDCRCEHQP